MPVSGDPAPSAALLPEVTLAPAAGRRAVPAAVEAAPESPVEAAPEPV